MRSSRNAALALALAAVLGACDDTPPDDPACATSYLRYDNFGEAFFLDWCRGCHSAALPGDMRQRAPVDVNFDTLADIRRWNDQIRSVVGVRQVMPPAGGPSDGERALVTEWLACGAP